MWYVVPGTRLIILKTVVFYFLMYSFFIFAFFFLIHDGGNAIIRTSTNVRVLAVVLPALLAGVIEFCLVCLVSGLCCCSSFWPVCFHFVFPDVV